MNSPNPFSFASMDHWLEQRIEHVDEWACSQVKTGVGRRRSVEIDKCLEGDLWQLQLQQQGRKYRLQNKKLLEPSLLRQAPACPHFDMCGGCQWQHLDAGTLLKRKLQLVKNCLSEVTTCSTNWHEPYLSPNVWRYRNKMEYSFGRDRDGRRSLGLHQSRLRVIDIECCPIAPDWFEKAIASVRRWWHSTDLAAYHHRTDEGSLRHLMLRQAAQGCGRMAVLTVSGNPNYALTQDQIQGFKQAILESVDPSEHDSLAIFVTLQQCIPSQPTRFFEWHLHGPDVITERLVIDWGQGQHVFDFTISPTTFFQPNTLAAQQLYAQALTMLQPQVNALVWDLFCGSGTLSILASRWAQQVIGVEINPMAVLDAKANAERNNRPNVNFECADLHKSPAASIKKLLEQGKPDAVLVDPPRAGLLEAGTKLLGEIAPKRIVYISCNPQSMGRDVACLKNYGYHLLEVAVVDQFPQTGHVETVGLLVHSSCL